MKDMEKIYVLRQRLHQIPETAWNEDKTRETIRAFLTENTSLDVTERDGFIYALHFEGEGLKTIGFRADFDAIVDGEGKPFHGCGHDGHTSVLCGLGLALEGKRLGKNIYLIFQPAEEIGEGAKICSALIKENGIERIYGFHNIPTFKEGQILTKRGVFACASEGLNIRLKGVQCHAAYPETGVNPAYIIGELVCSLKSLAGEGVMASIINIDVGSKNFGVSAGYGEISLTIRAYEEKNLNAFTEKIEGFVKERAKKQGAECEFEFFDVFPETVNDDLAYDEALKALEGKFDLGELKEPMRWSEDFGHYLKECKGVFFGIGDGEDYAALHTPDFCFNDNILEVGIRLFLALAEG